MGDPKRQRKKFDTPRFPWQIDTLEAELQLLGQYGLRNKREIWRHKTLLSKYRGIGRSLLGKSVEERRTLEKQLLNRLHRLGILPPSNTCFPEGFVSIYSAGSSTHNPWPHRH
jgi:small subunit ribosomal protein S4